MAKRHRHLLSPLDVSRAKPKQKPYRLADGGGLYLWVPLSGLKVWQFRYRHGGKPQTATLGKFSDAQGLAWARTKADEARSRVEDGDHLTRVKAAKKAGKRVASANIFAAVSAHWLKSETRRARWTPAYKDEVAASLRNHLAALDGVLINEITAAMAAPLLRKIERNAPDMAIKVRSACDRSLTMPSKTVSCPAIRCRPRAAARARSDPTCLQCSVRAQWARS